MSITLYSVQDLPQPAIEQVAVFVSEYTNGPAGLEAKLLPLSPADVAGRTGFIACDGALFRGYSGVSAPLAAESFSELGPFIVDPAYRRQGIGRRLLARSAYAALSEGQTPYVFGNAANYGNLTRVGFMPASAAECAEFGFGLCDTKCPFVEAGAACCNTPVVLRGEPQYPDESLGEWPAGQVLQMTE